MPPTLKEYDGLLKRYAELSQTGTLSFDRILEIMDLNNTSRYTLMLLTFIQKLSSGEVAIVTNGSNTLGLSLG